MQCKQTSVRCAVNDDMQELYPLIESSDAVVLGSPIYIGNVTMNLTTIAKYVTEMDDFNAQFLMEPGR